MDNNRGWQACFFIIIAASNSRDKNFMSHDSVGGVRDWMFRSRCPATVIVLNLCVFWLLLALMLCICISECTEGLVSVFQIIFLKSFLDWVKTSVPFFVVPCRAIARKYCCLKLHLLLFDCRLILCHGLSFVWLFEWSCIGHVASTHSPTCRGSWFS